MAGFNSGDPSGGGSYGGSTPVPPIFGGSSGSGPTTGGYLPFPVTNPIGGQQNGSYNPTQADYAALWSLMGSVFNEGSEPGGGAIPGGETQVGDDPATAPDGTTPSSGTNPAGPAAAKTATGGLLGTLANLFKNPTAMKALTSLGGLGLSAFGTALQAGNIQQAQDILKQSATKYDQLGAQGVNSAAPLMGGAANAAQSTINGSSPWSNLMLNSLIPNVGQLNNLLPSLLQRNFATESPGIMSALSSLSNNASSGPLQTLLDRATQNVNNGGATADSRNQFQQYQAMQSGATPVMQDLANGGASMLSSGGMTGLLQQLAGNGTNVTSTGGMTPQLASALAQSQQMLAGGGGNAATDAITQRGLALSSQNPLAPLSSVLSAALNQSGTREAQAAETARAQALARGGGPGATVANGVSNSAMADFADQGARAQSDAVSQALMGQQGLQLQQTGLGSQMAQGGQSLEAQRMSQLLNSISNLTSTATGRLNVGGNLALGASGNATQNMGVGGNLLNSYNQGSLGAGSLADAILTMEMGNQNANMGLINQGVGTQSGMYNSIINSLLSGAQGGAQAGASLGGLYLGNQNSYSNILNNGQQGYQSAANLLGNLGSDYLTFGNNQYSNSGNVATGEAKYAAQSPWGQFSNQLGGSLLLNGTLSPNGVKTQNPNGG